jgi:hypothetical protein
MPKKNMKNYSELQAPLKSSDRSFEKDGREIVSDKILDNCRYDNFLSFGSLDDDNNDGELEIFNHHDNPFKTTSALSPCSQQPSNDHVTTENDSNRRTRADTDSRNRKGWKYMSQVRALYGNHHRLTSQSSNRLLFNKKEVLSTKADDDKFGSSNHRNDLGVDHVTELLRWGYKM